MDFTIHDFNAMELIATIVESKRLFGARNGERMRIEEQVTFIETPEDIPFLTTPLFDVNMRLFHSSEGYRKVIESCCVHIKHLAMGPLDGYPAPFGMSGANVAIPFNIIGIIRNRGRGNRDCEIMINPHIVSSTPETVEMDSNCGSLRLKKSIKVRRARDIDVTWFDESGASKSGHFECSNGGATIQHEVDHNQGILITQRAGGMIHV